MRVKLPALVAKKINDSIDILLWNGLLFEDAFERIFEPLRSEAFKNKIYPLCKLLHIAAMEMSHNPVKIYISGEHHQISGVSLATAVEFQYLTKHPRLAVSEA